ncbi:histidine kinase [Asanoa sp. NPDC050611]|uniref:sensor histidine kinase n=1 Tax=Asanoa sp. NPDC050611 TaxID=3157098 RepID=UPI0033FB8F72
MCLPRRLAGSLGAARGRGVERALAGQSVLIAAVCVAVDAAAMAMGGLPLRSPVGAALLVLVVLVDAALVLPVRLAGWVALAHAVVRVGVTAAVWGVVSLHGTGGGPVSVGDRQVGFLIAGYRAGAWLRRWPAALSLGALVAGAAISRCFGADPEPLPVLVAVAANAVLPWLVGRYTTARRAHVDELRHRRESVAAAVARDRTVIARDLHDVISHHVSAIGVHAGAARLGLDARDGAGGPVARSLSAVEVASRAAMADLRTMLDVLHGNSDGAGQPGLANLDELVAATPVRLTVHGGARRLPGAVDVALYRVAQEMLTNALRHGDGTVPDLEIRYGADTVSLVARNGIGPAARLAGTGRGLAGVRTRAAMFDGTVSFGPDATGRRWETAVTVPTGED